MEIDYYMIDCPICDDGKKHRSRILKKQETEDRAIMEVECEDCHHRGVVKVLKAGGVEIYDF
ncbi:hypothetical protein DDW07_02885 [Acidilobus sp. SCGC AC-742_E15]|nr:hypothetical protein DDW07_02885 [Acidilobus sp. SCGC AC-742_E15]